MIRPALDIVADRNKMREVPLCPILRLVPTFRSIKKNMDNYQTTNIIGMILMWIDILIILPLIWPRWFDLIHT